MCFEDCGCQRKRRDGKDDGGRKSCPDRRFSRAAGDPSGLRCRRAQLSSFSPAGDHRIPTRNHPTAEVLQECCNGCGVCADVCEYRALTLMMGRVLVFGELCHGCGACFMLCSRKAIVEKAHPVGSVEEGLSRGIRLVQGRLDVGQVMSPAVIRQVRVRAGSGGVCIIDSPPGTSCPVVESIREADFVLLVTEPTPFGLNDLSLAVEMSRACETLCRCREPL